MTLGGASFLEDVSLVEFMYLVFTRMPGGSYSRRLRSLLFFVVVFVLRIGAYLHYLLHLCYVLER